MLVTDGRSWPPSRFGKRYYGLWDRLRAWLELEVEVVDGANRYRFRCQNLWEYLRCAGMFVKEPGTCAWIEQTFESGEVFYDVGANIGIYTILAGFRVGGSGAVYAFEPHAATFARLLDNIMANQLQGVVRPCSFALHDHTCLSHFNYRSNVPGTAGSQLASRQLASEEAFDPTVTEIKQATSIDALLASGEFLPPDHVKIDVDGNELLILKGMTDLLDGPARPRSIQVEINQRDQAEIEPFLNSHGYRLTKNHYSRTAQKKIAKGRDPADYAYNSIFRPAT